ncbi:MAG: DUF58 domain-containing protein [Proteobacteria bacterium]|nr:DUF58 domain-containing protein [Pseudomonadota bacterium]
MQPTLRAFIVFAAGIPLGFALILADETLWPLAFGYLTFAAAITTGDAVLTPRIGAFAIDLQIPPMLYVGDRDAITVTLSGAALRHPTMMTLACDTGDTLEPPPHQLCRIIPGERFDIRIPLIPNRRGQAVIHRLWLRWHGPLGLVERRHIRNTGVSVPIVPNIRAVRSAALSLSVRDAAFGVKIQRQSGEGTEFDALRDYMPGLDHRSIDWKHSARHHKLVCKEFRTERNHQVILAFDTGHLMSTPLHGIPRIDHAINAGLLLGHASLRHGDRIGVFGFDAQTRVSAEPFGGIHEFSRLMRLTSEIEYHQEETNFTRGLMELMTRLKRRSLIILQTEFVDTVTAELMVENLQRLAARHLVIFVSMHDPRLHSPPERSLRTLKDVNRLVVADGFLRERRTVFERLRRMGIHCIDAPSHAVGAELLNRYIHIKQLELI